MINQIKGSFFGAAVGDALGVPVEFSAREALRHNPVNDLRGYGVWHQPPGTFSDDSSLLFCTAESLCSGFSLNDIAARFIRWSQQGYWGAHNAVFDIGGATRAAISRLLQGTSPLLSGGMFENDNGNGSLMRILPVAFYLRKEPSVSKRYEIIKQLSGITHQHFRSVMACFIYTELCLSILTESDAETAYRRMQRTVNEFIGGQSFSSTEIILFNRVLQDNIADIPEEYIQSSGYVVHTLESSVWCFFNTSSYSEAVLKAVNLGGDTDTTGTVTGGLAGLRYGYDAIPTDWTQRLAKAEEITDLVMRFFQAVQ